jgi:3-oxoadipate enol-lactonase
MKSGKIRRINTRIGELAVHEHGGGDETIVFWPALYTDHRMYAQQVAAFSDSYRLLVIDPPGHGASPAPCDLVSMPDCAEAVIEVLDAYGLQKVHWVGTSWGGIVGAHLGAAHPERFESLLLANTPFDHGDPSALRGAKFVVGLAQIFGGSSVFGKGVARSFFPDPGKVRTMVVAGGKDKLYPQEGLRNAAALIPGAEFYLAAGSGHLSAFEAPVEFNRMLSNWIGGR